MAKGGLRHEFERGAGGIHLCDHEAEAYIPVGICGGLGISRTALHDYSKGRGNPSTATIEHIARTLGIAPAVLVTGLADEDRREIILLLLDTVDGIARLSGEKRLRLAELFMEMVRLWDAD